MAYNKRITSCLLVLALLSVFWGSIARTANAGSDYGASNWAVHYLQVAGEVAAAVALQKLTTKILDKIKNSGPDDGVGFIQNWINFQTKSQYQGEAIFRAELSKATLCNYFGSSLKKLFGATDVGSLAGQNTRTNNLDDFKVRTNCTMPSNFNLANYQKDFAGNGGWQAFSRMLEPQNNYYGSFFQSLDEVSAQRALTEKSAINESLTGGGFFGFLSGIGGCKLRGPGNICLVKGDIKIPGSTVDKSVANALDNSSRFLSSPKSDVIVTQAVVSLTSWITNKLFDLAASSNNPSDNSQIPSPERTADSYKQEFCMAEDNVSQDAGFWIKDNYPQTWNKYPVEQPKCKGHLRLLGLGGYSHNACGKSYCEQVREEFDKNEYPYSRCTESCMNDIKGPPGVALPPSAFTPGTFISTTGGSAGDLSCTEQGVTDNYIGDIKSAANQYLAAHPQIANLPSYDAGSGGSAAGEAAVAQLRDGVIATLISRGFKAGTVSDPSGSPYYQMVALGKSNDSDATVYRVTAGGAVISEAIKSAYCNSHVPWSSVK